MGLPCNGVRGPGRPGRAGYIGLLLGTCLVAAWLRFPVPEPAWHHIDERAFLLQPLAFWSGDLNPHFFNYPTLQLYLASGLYYLYYAVTGAPSALAFVAYRYFVDGHDLIFIARVLTTVMAVATVAVTARLATRVYGPAAGLLSALLLAVAPLHTRFSHLATTDVPSALWTTLAVLWAVRIVQQGVLRDAAIAGIFVGLAASTKYPGVFAAAPVGVALWLRTRDPRSLAVAAGTAAAALALTSPYLLLAPTEAWQGLAGMGAEHLFSEVHQASAVPPLFFVGHTLRYGFGAAALVTLAAALLWRPKSFGREELVLLSGVLALCALPAFARSGFMRYAVPAAPLLAVLVARPLTQMRLPRWVLCVWIAALFIEPAVAAWRTRCLLSAPDTRAQALEWIGRTQGPGYRLHVECGRGGALGVLTPGILLTREFYFARSYDEDRLRLAYRLLSERSDYPPLAVEVDLDDPRHIPAAADAPGAGLLLRCEHPLCGTDPSELGPVDWVARFDAGQVERAVYDPVDMYFLPVSGFAALSATGPRVHIGRIGLPVDAPVPSLQEWFRLRWQVLEASQAVREGRWTEADRIHAAIFEQPFVVSELLTRPSIFELLMGAGTTRYHLGSPPEALARWQQALPLNSDESALHTNIGTALADMGRHEEAVSHFQRASDLAPASADLLFNLGTGYLRLGQYHQAALVLETAIGIRPDADSYSNLGWACLLDGRSDLAEGHLQRALQLRPGHHAATRGLDKLRARDGGSPP